MAHQCTTLPFHDAAAIRAALPPRHAVVAVRSALAAGLEPATETPRTAVPLAHGQLLLMPSEFGAHAGVKVLTVAPENPARNLPRIQGVYILFDAETATPTALLDGPELTAVRTAAVSLAAVHDRLLADRRPIRVVIFGAGTQARSHLRTLIAVIEGQRAVAEVVIAVRSPRDVTGRWATAMCDAPTAVVGIGTAAVDRAIAGANLIICATGSAEPLFDGSLVSREATVICVGAHEPQAREVDDTLIASANVMVENPATATREVGAVISAVDAGRFDPSRLIPLGGDAHPELAASSAPLVFISTGMSWEDLVIATAVTAAIAQHNSVDSAKIT